MEETAESVEQAPRFAVDRMLKRLARWLRLMGADVICDEALSGAETLRLAREQGRPLLTRDKRLRTADDVLYIEGHLFRDQIREVMARYPFDPRRFAFTRCSNCNDLLKRVSRETVARRVPPFVYAAHESFAECERCGRILWDASHVERAMREIDALTPPQR
ncbi:MAG TPA: Mut7-C RNAse domain-containing protein [Candidatus Binataceae bacterium]|nr:Mut7-C RNAse domain-containing protein [Candidatus Binataceae bacterium]